MIARILSCFLALSSATKTVLQFSRKVSTCDDQDRPFENSTTKIVWSYHSQDPVGESSIPQHEYQGVKSVRFFTQELPPQNEPSDKQYFDLLNPHSHVHFDDVPYPGYSPTTNYWISCFKMVVSRKRHIYRIEPLIDPRHTQWVHHVTILRCPVPLTDEEVAWQGRMEDPNIPHNVSLCNGGEIFHGWAIGGAALNYPSHVGYPMEDETQYLIIQTHFENSEMTPFEDNSGFRFWYTENELRRYDAGIFVFGVLPYPVLTIPGNQASFTYNAQCPGECTSQLFPTEGIKVFAGVMHTHLVGKRTRLSHIRNGTELPPLIDEPYYDFNYQDYVPFDEVDVLPGDTILVTCEYDTSSRPNTTFMGFSSHEEMCQGTVIYYPRIPDALDRQICYTMSYNDLPPKPNSTTDMLICGNVTLTSNFSFPNYTAYQPPACTYEPPPNSTSPYRPLSEYERSEYLDTDHKYKLYWTTDTETREIHAAVEVETAGWVGFGISPKGMVGADVLIGWVKDGEVYLKDRLATAHSLPAQDILQDYFYVTGTETSSSEPFKLSTREIVGIAIGAGLFFVGVIVFVMICLRRRSKPTSYHDFQEQAQHVTLKSLPTSTPTS